MKSVIKQPALLLTATLFSLFAAAQKKLDVDINVGEKNVWYQQTWVWVVGGAVFILLLAAILRKK